MSSQEQINKMKENILSGASNFIGTKAPQNYCDCQDACKLLAAVSNQYNTVVKQNQSLQKTIQWQKDQMDKDNAYLIKLEEANMLFEQDNENLKRQVETLQEADRSIGSHGRRYDQPAEADEVRSGI